MVSYGSIFSQSVTQRFYDNTFRRQLQVLSPINQSIDSDREEPVGEYAVFFVPLFFVLLYYRKSKTGSLFLTKCKKENK